MKIKIALLALFMLAIIAGSVSATDVTISDADLATMSQLYGPATLTTVTDIAGPGVRFDFTGHTGAWDGTEVGHDFWVGPTTPGIEPGICGGTWGGDCSAYSAYASCVENIGDTEVHVNLDMNTGWTGEGSSNTFAQNGWNVFAPGEKKTITLSFSGADLYPTPGSNPVPLTTEVSKIGFQVASNVAGPKSIIVTGGACPPPDTGGGGGDTEIPEFPTAAIPAVFAIGGYLLIRRRKQA